MFAPFLFLNKYDVNYALLNFYGKIKICQLFKFCANIIPIAFKWLILYMTGIIIYIFTKNTRINVLVSHIK